MFTLTFVVFVALTGLARGQGDCSAKGYHGFQCCTLEFPKDKREGEVINKCLKKHVRGNSSLELEDARFCVFECAFSEMGLLTVDRKLDQDALSAKITDRNPTLRPAMLANAQKCFTTYEAQVDPGSECKSGAYEFQRCLSRETFLNCPSSGWTASSECDEMKANVSKCPNAPVFMCAKHSNYLDKRM